jgi:adenosyl cobinamide kinase/adenosyl cobinamide phosphate guanylyltransferase
VSEQLHLVDVVETGPGPDTRSRTAKPLTANQQRALDYIASRDGTTCDELGAWIHAHRERRPHSVDVRCDWCAKTGRQLVTSKALAPLLT